MNFNLNLDDDDRALPRRPLGPPKDFTSRAFRLRLMSLFAGLILVVILMQEAGKPERWAWMGFDRMPVPSADGVVKPIGQDDAVEAAEEETVDPTQTPLPAFWSDVQDDTPVGHVGDRAAWSGAWQQVAAWQPLPAGEQAAANGAATAIPIERIQLMSQPAEYRGRRVSLTGWVRSARFVPRSIEALSANAAGVMPAGNDGYYELWIRPEETNAGPYCVYALSLPDEFPIVGNDFRELNQPVHVNALFFKRRTYVAADRQATACPLLLARSFRQLPGATSSVDQPAWLPTMAQTMVIAILLAMLAAAIAWWARQNAQTPRYQPGVVARQQIDQSLEQLGGDSSVMTDRENVIAFEQAAREAQPGPKDG